LAIAGVKFFIDECLSPQLARRLNEWNIDALHPLDAGRRGEADHTVLKRCLDEDRVIVTENAADFRGLVGAEKVHPGLVILPAVDREGSWRLLQKVLTRLEMEADPRTFMVNRVVEVDQAGKIRVYQLPPASRK
jgi:predicted nuclease of predicted toxin-antitoxin system